MFCRLNACAIKVCYISLLISRQAPCQLKRCYSVAGWLACLVARFRPRFNSVWSRPSATALSKRLTMVQMFSHINTLNCLPPPIHLCVLKHVRTRLIILTSDKNNHKIKVAEIGQLAVGIRLLDCKHTFIISEILSTLTTCKGREGREGREEREGREG